MTTRWMWGVASVICVAPLAGQRDTVLSQVRIPHTYYWLEMYVPQVTSGPSSASWSPDGRSLVYAMQGTLWRQTFGDTTAVQLTDGPGYDFQPDWSPDGRRIVFARWAHEAIELQSLDLASFARDLDAPHRRYEQRTAAPLLQPVGSLSLAHLVSRRPRADPRLESRAHSRQRRILAHAGRVGRGRGDAGDPV